MSITDKDYEDATDVIENLRKYLEYGNDEFEEAGNLICRLLSYPDYIEDDLWLRLLKEAKDHLKYYKENTKWVETEETFTRTVIDLEYTDR